MQGRLRGKRLRVEVATECGHCGRKLHLDLDGELRVAVKERDANPLVFEPDVDWARFSGTNIIHDY